MNLKCYSAFILHESGEWEQPSFMCPEDMPEDQIKEALFRVYGGFYIAGLQEDPDAPTEGLLVLGVK